MTELIVLDSLDWTRATLDFERHGGSVREVLDGERAFGIEPLHVTALR